MSFSTWERQALDSIRDGIAGSDPKLAALLGTFSRLASDDEMPARENLAESSRRITPRTLRKRRRRHQRLGLHWGALLGWLLVSVTLIAVAAALSRGSQGSGSQANCAESWITSCAGSAPAQRPAPATHGPKAIQAPLFTQMVTKG